MLLLAVASHCDDAGEWRASLATLQRLSRLQRRRVQQVVDELIADGELQAETGNGRGNDSLYRLAAGKGAPECTLSPAEPEKGCNPVHPLEAKPTERVHSSAPFSRKGAAECTLSEPQRVQPVAPFFPSSPPCTPPNNPTAPCSSSAVDPGKELRPPARPLSGSQQAVATISRLFETASIPVPGPGQIAGWIKTLGGVTVLEALVTQLIAAGLAKKSRPDAYVHQVVMDRSTAGAARHGRPSHHTAGADDTRRKQAQRLLEEGE